jgi:hypothetical protein
MVHTPGKVILKNLYCDLFYFYLPLEVKKQLRVMANVSVLFLPIGELDVM